MYSNKMKILAMAALLPFAATSFGVTAQAVNYSITCESGEKAKSHIAQPYCVFFEKEADKKKFLEDVNFFVAKSINDGPIAIHVYNPYEKIISDIIDPGINVDTQPEKPGLTPLMYSSLLADSLSVNLLIGFRADVNMKDSYGNTALDYAQIALNHIRYFKSVVTDKIAMLYAAPDNADYVFIANAQDLDLIENHIIEIINILEEAGAENHHPILSRISSRTFTDYIAAQQALKK